MWNNIHLPQQNLSPTLWPQHHGEDGERVPVADAPKHLIVEFVRQCVGLLHLGATVGGGGRTRQHVLHIRPVIRLVCVFGGYETDGLQTHGRGQGSVLFESIPYGGVEVDQTVDHQADGVVYEEDNVGRYVVLQILAWVTRENKVNFKTLEKLMKKALQLYG